MVDSNIVCGMCKGIGNNHLGKILMKIRFDLWTNSFFNDTTTKQGNKNVN